MKQARNYCFTDFQLLDLETIYNENKDIVRYICWGEEVCPSTKKKHNQGWIQFFNKKRFGGVKRLFGCKKIHIEACYGNEFKNDKYCKKDNKFKQLGKFVTQGQRTDLEDIKKNIIKGAKLKNVMNDHFETYCRYRNGIKDFYQVTQKEISKKWRDIKVEYVWGSTGTGKTRYAMKEAQYKITGDALQWWDGYENEKTILIDEYDNNIPITQMLNILDGYHLRLPVKGGFTYAHWNRVIITSNLSPDMLHTNAKEAHRDALFRRITKIVPM